MVGGTEALVNAEPTGNEPTSVAPDLMRRRVQYEVSGLHEEDLAATPLAQFEAWFADAVASAVPEPNAMELATCGPDGPQVRVVLAKDVSADGVRFFTNLGSAKAREIEHDPRVAVVFMWGQVHRQVRISGVATPVSREESAQYFATRPRDAQIGAWASRQSQILSSRSVLSDQVAHFENAWPGGAEIPLPDHWGGFLIRPSACEFWQGQPSRLHDRLRFTSTRPGARLDHPGDWSVERLSP